MRFPITQELPALLRAAPLGSSLDLDRASVFGHSMGGHGALVVGLRNPTRFRTISAFSPISNPINAPWGVKAFTGACLCRVPSAGCGERGMGWMACQGSDGGQLEG